MLKSMTGYGRREQIVNGKKITAEIKSVNHRYADYNIKIPRHMGFLEDNIRKFISERAARGKIDVYIAVDSFNESDKNLYLNEELASDYIKTLEILRDKFGLKDDISVMSVARYTDIFKTEQKQEDSEEVWRSVREVLEPAVGDFLEMRSREGARIENDLRQRIEYMRSLALKIDERSPQTVEEYKNRLYAKIKEVLDDRSVDEARVLTEVAIFADKVAVNEETVRLASHFDEFERIISGEEPAGRQLDFLIQEINRETNTIGSKASDVEITEIVIELKGEIEKLREQVQNIE